MTPVPISIRLGRKIKWDPKKEQVIGDKEANKWQSRKQRKGFETTILLYGPGVTLGVQRGFPTIGDEAFPGHQNYENQLKAFMDEGGKVYACRFALQALYGHGEPALVEGIQPISPLDVLDIQLIARRDNAYVVSTWTM